MPHSSGGGHGGGGHGGGGHGGGRGGHSSGPSRRVSYSAFLGSRRYSYHVRDRVHYVYADYDIRKTKLIDRPLMLLFYIPFFFGIICMFANVFHNPKKINDNHYSKQIIIEDNAGVINNHDELEAEMEAFYNETGITPAIVTVYRDDWQRYQTLEDYAYSTYLYMFPDEMHWLIVYSVENNTDNMNYYWAFEGMQGNDTDPILTSKVTTHFNRQLTRNLSGIPKSEVGQAFANTFSHETPHVMDFYVDWEYISISLLAAGFVVLHAFFMAGIHPNALYYQNAKLEAEDSRIKCIYCNREFYTDQYEMCPYCNRPYQ